MQLKSLDPFVGRLAVPTEFKTTGAKGSGDFEGYASTRKLDSDRDIVQPGAFKRTIDHIGSKGLAYLWFHRPDDPIGIIHPQGEDEKGLFVTGTVDVDIEQGARVYSGMVKGYIDRMSIGYEAKRARWDPKAKARLLDEVALREISAITKNFAANDEALITAVKSASACIHQWVNAEGYGGTSLDVYTAAPALADLVTELRAMFESGVLAELGASLAVAQDAQDDVKDSGPGSRTAHPAPGDGEGSALATLIRDATKSIDSATSTTDQAKAADLFRDVLAELRG
jgi:HK97 family phage prohead protease